MYLQLLSLNVAYPHGVMVKTMNSWIVVSEIPFRLKIFGKDMNPLILPAMG